MHQRISLSLSLSLSSSFFLFVLICSTAIVHFRDGFVMAGLGEMWRIEDPMAVLLSPAGENPPATSDGTETDGTGKEMSFQLEYTISSTPKYARYRILKKNCREYYKPGQEPVIAKAPVAQQQQQQSVEDGDTKDHTRGQIMYIPTIEPSETNSQDQKVTAKFVAKVPPRISSDDDDTVEFCVRIGVFLPPQAGEMEVNFRETNVKMSFENIDEDSEKDAIGTSSSESPSSATMDMIWSYVDYFVSLVSQRKVRLKDVTVEPCPLREVDIKLFGNMASSDQPKKAGEEDTAEGEGEGEDDESDSGDRTNDKEAQKQADETDNDADSGDDANNEL
mmetsp:Transcript_22527/g.53204  ORF Transcript_22527/g.53204 Transcript_22527/m.53204 type:complete len:334 (+) Transcript_22527:86-1087(+)